jgi:hypothetical protein
MSNNSFTDQYNSKSMQVASKSHFLYLILSIGSLQLASLSATVIFSTTGHAQHDITHMMLEIVVPRSCDRGIALIDIPISYSSSIASHMLSGVFIKSGNTESLYNQYINEKKKFQPKSPVICYSNVHYKPNIFLNPIILLGTCTL